MGLTCASGEIRLHASVPACAAAALADALRVHRVEALRVRQRIETISGAHMGSALAVHKDEQRVRIADRGRVWDFERVLAAHTAEIRVVEGDAVAYPRPLGPLERLAAARAGLDIRLGARLAALSQPLRGSSKQAHESVSDLHLPW